MRSVGLIPAASEESGKTGDAARDQQNDNNNYYRQETLSASGALYAAVPGVSGVLSSLIRILFAYGTRSKPGAVGMNALTRPSVDSPTPEWSAAFSVCQKDDLLNLIILFL